MRIQKEAGILERGIAALRSGIASLLGLSSEPKPEVKVCQSAASAWPDSQQSSQHLGYSDGP